MTLKISDVAFGGEGVGRIGDFVVFVPFVITDETAEVEIIEVKKNFARARLVRIIGLTRRVDQPKLTTSGGSARSPSAQAASKPCATQPGGYAASHAARARP